MFVRPAGICFRLADPIRKAVLNCNRAIVLGKLALGADLQVVVGAVVAVGVFALTGDGVLPLLALPPAFVAELLGLEVLARDATKAGSSRIAAPIPLCLNLAAVAALRAQLEVGWMQLALLIQNHLAGVAGNVNRVVFGSDVGCHDAVAVAVVVVAPADNEVLVVGTVLTQGVVLLLKA